MGAAPNDHRLFEGNDMTTPNIEELPAPETLAQMAEACETLTSLMLIIPGIDTGAWAKTLREADASMQSQAERIKELNLQVVSAFGQAQEALEERDTLRAKMVPLEKDAARYRWLRERYTAVNFDWEESGQQAVIFTADDFPIASASCDKTIDAAMGITGEPK